MDPVCPQVQAQADSPSPENIPFGPTRRNAINGDSAFPHPPTPTDGDKRIFQILTLQNSKRSDLIEFQ